MKKSIALMLVIAIFNILIASDYYVNNVAEFRQALHDAVLNGENDRIFLKPGIYNIDKDGKGTFNFKDNEEFNISIIGDIQNGNDKVILDGNGLSTVLNIENKKSFSVKLENLIIRNAHGPGIRIFTTSSHSTVMSNCTVVNNDDGGVYIYSWLLSQVKISNSIIAHNKSTGDGGGLYLESCKVFLNEVEVFDNHANGLGGGIRIFGSGNVENVILNSKIEGNSAAVGGGLAVEGVLSLISSTINENLATQIGGGIYNNKDQYNFTTLHKTVVANNKSKDHAAGLHGSFVIVNSILNNNALEKTDVYDGGFNIYGFILNSDFLNNSNGYFGGLFVNNIFFNSKFETCCSDQVFFNNYINGDFFFKIEKDTFAKNNIIEIKEDSLFLDKNMIPLKGSPIIDKGINPKTHLLEKYFEELGSYSKYDNEIYSDIYKNIIRMLSEDYYGNRRDFKSIDIGAVEYQSDNEQSNHNIDVDIKVNGEYKIYAPITIQFTITSKKPLSSIFFSKDSNMPFKSIAIEQKSIIITYENPGKHNFRLKVIDIDGNVKIIEKMFVIKGMTVKEAIEFGKNICISNPSQCGIMDSKQELINNPTVELERISSLLKSYSFLNISGYFIHYNDPESIDKRFDWIYIPQNKKSIYKLNGMKKDGSFLWSKNFSHYFTDIEVDAKGKFVNFK